MAGSGREIDLAARPTGRLAWLARLIVRVCQILFWLAVTIAAAPIFLVARRSWRGAAGAAATFLFQRLGATFIKVGQIMSTRPDIFSAEFIAPITTLQDRVPGFSFADVRRTIEEDFRRKLEEIFEEFDRAPIASASIAQVHRAVLQEAELPPTFPSRTVAVKVRRPGIVRRAYFDEAILRFVGRALSLIPTLFLLSPLEAIAEFCEAVNRQLDFRIEADNNRRFRKDFDDDAHLVFPALVDQLCSDRVLTMELIHGVGIDRIHAVGSDPTFIARKSLEIIARMVFQHGFVHADLHPGNVLYMAGNRIALLDVGLVGVLDHEHRRRFALFIYFTLTGQGAETARWLHEEAQWKRVTDYAAYERDMVELVAHNFDRPVSEVQYTARLAELFALLRRHRLRLEATFTMEFIALVTGEGIARKLGPKLNPGREMRPYVESALALGEAARSSGAEAPAASPPAAPLTIAAGRYRMRRLLGEGVRKRVYLARDTRLARDVAVAFIRTEDLDEAAANRIQLEARTVARLAEHPRIVPVYDSGEEDGVPFVVSQYMGGGTLAGRLLRATDHRLALSEALRFADQILQALEHAHAHGVVHRDVKPENVWLTEDGFAKLGDFGLARTIGRIETAAEGLTVGTALYMPPEQALGRGVDQRSDLYSLGATLYELVTGHSPFAGESVAEVIAKHVNEAPAPPSKLNPAMPLSLDAVLLKLLAKLPESRFESAADVRSALRGIREDEVAGRPAEPEPIPSRTATLFVGREQETTKLRGGLEEVLAGHGRLFLVVGEPGIGKTRMAELLSGYAAQRGFVVLSGRSFEGAGAPAFWPWVQILRGYAESADRARLETELGAGAPYVAQIVPELREVLPDLPAAREGEADGARFRLFDAVSTFLKRASVARPLFLFLDDLHWADTASLLLLQFLARELGGSRIFIVATYRNVDVQHGHPLAEVLPTLRRERAFERVLLRGLPEDDVRALVRALAGADASEPLVRAIYRETEGNPFFIEETLRHLAEERVVGSFDDIGLPEGVREVISRRLARLSDDCRKILATASVLGRDFDAPVLEQVAGIGRERLSELLREAEGALIVEIERKGSRHRFSHTLIRETLYAELGTAERIPMHGRIADALLALHAGDVDTHLSELAYHLFEASAGGDAKRAIEFNLRAAARAERQYAYEEAAAFYDRARRALEASDDVDGTLLCETLIGLGTAQFWSGDAKSVKTLRHAADTAKRFLRAEPLARAAISYKGEDMQTVFPAFDVDEDMVRLLETALSALPDTDSALRATVMGRLASSLLRAEQEERRRELFARAEEMAEGVGDKRALAGLLYTKCLARWGIDPLATLRTDVERLVLLADELDDDRMSFFACGIQAMFIAEAGDIEGAAPWFLRVERMGERMPHLRWGVTFVRGGWAMAAAKQDQVDELIQRTYRGAMPALGAGLSFAFFEIQTALNLWQRGRSQEAAARIREIGAYSVSFAPFAALMPVFTEKEADARELLRCYPDPSAFPRDQFWLSATSLTALAVDRIGDASRARVWYAALLPHSDRAVNPGGVYCFGSVARYLARLAKTLSWYEEAADHYERALEVERQMPVWLARTRAEYAALLRLRDAPGDRIRALELCGQAAEGARQYGMAKVAAEAIALKLELEGVTSADVRSSIDAVTASIEAKGIDVRRATAPNGTVTLLFSDMEGFAELTEELGDAEAHRLVQMQRRILREALADHGGSEIEEQAGGFLFAFPKAIEALRYATAAQRTLAAHRAEHPGDRIHVRMGLHTGEPIREGDRFYGKTVILAARIAAHAKGDEVLVSSIVRELASSADELRFQDGGEEVVFQGLSGVHRVHAFTWDPDAASRRQRPAVAEKAPSGNAYRREGDFWTITYEHRSIRMKDAKGLQYIAQLLRRQGGEVHVADLVNGVAIGARTSITAVEASELSITADLGDAGEALDAKARDDYRARLESLRSELEGAQATNDTGRSAVLQQEIEFLTQELASAYGLGGRSRRISAPSERARKAVSSRVLDSISRIRKENPDLGAHLGNSIRLGFFCHYKPEKPVTWSF